MPMEQFSPEGDGSQIKRLDRRDTKLFLASISTTMVSLKLTPWLTPVMPAMSSKALLLLAKG